MNFWAAFAIYVGACALVVFGLSINGKTDAPAGGHGDHGHGHGHDDHGHGHH